jgi:hypothetical protein
MILATPAQYTEISRTAPGVVHIRSGNVGDGAPGTILQAAGEALLFTLILVILVFIIGFFVMGVKPFLSRIGMYKPHQNSQ